MADNKVLLDAAALLVKIANEQSGVKSDPKLDAILATWQEMVRQQLERQKPHAWVDWKPGVLPSDTGDNTPESPFYEKFKNFWQAMERQRVSDHTGQPFNSLMLRKEGGWKAFEEAIKFMAKTQQGRAWFNDPLNANYLPKSQDMLLLN